MPQVTMTARVSGTRNGKPWPDVGESIVVGESEAEGLVNLGLAHFADGPVVERAETRTAEPSKTATRTPRKSAAKKS